MEMMWKNHNGVSTMGKKGGNSHASNVVPTPKDSLSPSQQPWLLLIYHSLWVPRWRWHDWRQLSPGFVACNSPGANLHKLVSFQWQLHWDLDGSWWLGSTVCVSSRVRSQRLLRTKALPKRFFLAFISTLFHCFKLPLRLRLWLQYQVEHLGCFWRFWHRSGGRRRSGLRGWLGFLIFGVDSVRSIAFWVFHVQPTPSFQNSWDQPQNLGEICRLWRTQIIGRDWSIKTCMKICNLRAGHEVMLHQTWVLQPANQLPCSTG